MAWVVFDRAVRLVERFGLEAPLERWKQTREDIHREVCEQGYDSERGTFTQYYGSKELDASTLNIPLVGFLPATDERVTGTIDAISRELGRDGFVSRYSTAETDDGLPGDEGQFLACSFWLVSALALNGRVEQARTLFERLLGLSNDLGLLGRGVRRQPPAPGRQLPTGVQPPHADRGCARHLHGRGRRSAPARVSETTTECAAGLAACERPLLDLVELRLADRALFEQLLAFGYLFSGIAPGDRPHVLVHL